VEEVAGEIHRMRQWLGTDQRQHWTQEIRLLGRRLEEAQQELFTAKLSKLQNATAMQEMTVQRLRRQMRDAEDKQRITKRWSRELEDRTDPLAKEVDGLHTFLTIDMVRAAARLDQIVKMLEAYARVAPAGGSAAHAPEAAEESGAPATGTGGGGPTPGDRS
jgi:chromosome segregation ATPase